MYKMVFLLLASASVLISASNATAEGIAQRFHESMYVSTFLGLNMLGDVETDTSYTTTPAAYRETYMQDTGYSFSAAIGGHLNERLRGEIEFGVNTSNQATIREVINGLNVNNYRGKGDIRTYKALANLWADLALPQNMYAATPYIGGGLGLAYVDSNLIYTNTPTYGPQDSSVEFAAQLGAGINWDLNETMQLGFGYRLNFVNGPTTQQTTAVGEITTYNFDNLVSHAVGVTLTVKLN